VKDAVHRTVTEGSVNLCPSWSGLGIRYGYPNVAQTADRNPSDVKRSASSRLCPLCSPSTALWSGFVRHSGAAVPGDAAFVTAAGPRDSCCC